MRLASKGKYEGTVGRMSCVWSRAEGSSETTTIQSVPSSLRPSLLRPIPELERCLRRGRDISCDVELVLRRPRAHVPHRPEHRPPIERPVELPEDPEDPPVASRVPPIERVLVVQVLQHPERVGCVRGPRQDALPPEHPDVVVELAIPHQ